MKKKSPASRDVVTALLKMVDADIDPFSLIPTGDVWLSSSVQKEKHYRRFTFHPHHLFHMFSLRARYYTIAEIKEEFIFHYLNWPKLRELGKKKHCENEMKREELKRYLKEAKASKNNVAIKALTLKIAMLPDVTISCVAQELVTWLKREIQSTLAANSKGWESWVAEERRLWNENKSESIPVYAKDFRMTVIDRILNMELAKPSVSYKAVLEILKAAKDEVEGNLVTVKFELEDVEKSIMEGKLTRDDWVDIAVTCSKMLKDSSQPKIDVHELLSAGSSGGDGKE